ncbi:hypothetical protein SteCoe_23271 [Stentor coeruleus]|uniref:Uncharacterized protein n=1 Tax=Stentor coeruleus TaxID=5963 RepID=A0A1R2BKB1_9CILI|nr:hypothetical protein SteCoe_23271 [Stentor coeruleus]
MECYLCNGKNPEYLALVNINDKKSEKICSKCSKQTKSYCTYCTELKLTKDIKLDQGSYLNCNKCAQKNILKCSFCEYNAVCYCQCNLSYPNNNPESFTPVHNQISPQSYKNIPQANQYGINNIPQTSEFSYNLRKNNIPPYKSNHDTSFTSEDSRKSDQDRIGMLKPPAIIPFVNSDPQRPNTSLWNSNSKGQNPMMVGRADATNFLSQAEGNSLSARNAERSSQVTQSISNYCQKCAEKHFYTKILENSQHQFIMYGNKSITPDFLDLSIDYRKIENFESAGNRDIINQLMVLCQRNHERKFSGSVLDYYFTELKVYQNLYEFLKKPEYIDIPEASEMRLMFAEIYLFIGKKNFGLDVIKYSQNSLLNYFNYARICTYYLSKNECSTLTPLTKALEIIKKAKNSYDPLEYYTVTAKLRYIFKAKQTKARSLKDAILENLVPSMTKVRAMVTYCKITKKIKFIESAIDYVKTYFQGIPELAWLISMKVKILWKKTDILITKSLLESAMQIICSFYGGSNYFEAKCLYKLALFEENGSQKYYISLQAIKIALDLGEIKIAKKCFKILEPLTSDSAKKKLQDCANILDYLQFNN